MKVIFGIHSIEEALGSNQPIEKLFLQKGSRNIPLEHLRNEANEAGIPVSIVPHQKLDKLAHGNHQGAVAQISPINYTPLSQMIEQAFSHTENPLFLLCDGVSDVRNFGAIVRTAECSGVQGIIIPKHGSAAINEQTVKTSSGAIFNVPIARVAHLKDALYFLKSYQVQLVAATEKERQLVYDVDFRQPSAIIMGDEGKGITPSVLKMADKRVKLPLLGKTSSLNVSVACGLFLYEAVRQKL